MALQQGGVGSSIVSNGKILGAASFYPMLGQATVFGIFTAMSIATGQFFLFQITKELRMINQKLDEIMKFLYGDKKAELLSEVSFIKDACDNYVSIMAHESQRMATIVSIQEAKKVARKDIEFYMNDLKQRIESGKKKDFKFLDDLIDNAIKPVEENLELSLLLYFLSSLMEVYYAQNYEEAYICNLKESIKSHVDLCNAQLGHYNGMLMGHLENCKVSGKDEPKLQERKENLRLSNDAKHKKYNDLCETLYSVLHTATQKAEYYLKADGEVYDVYYKVS